MFIRIIVYERIFPGVYSLEEKDRMSLEKETEFPININTADSATLVSLTGIGRKTAHKIMEHRRRGGTIHNFAELEAIQNIPSNASERLKQQIRYSDEDTQKD